MRKRGRMWKLLLLGAAGGLLLSARSGEVELVVNGVRTAAFSDYQLLDDTVFLPLRETAAALGMKGYADPETLTVYLQAGDKVAVVDSARRAVRVGSEETPLRFTPIWNRSQVYIPHPVFTDITARLLGVEVSVELPAFPDGVQLAGEKGEGERKEGETGLAGAARNAVDVILLDPGHGGHDPGARGPGWLLEKDVVLEMALKLKTRLEEEAGVKVYLTRSADEFIPLSARSARAREVNADLFVSLHANGHKYMSAEGFETFFASLTATDPTALALARFENQEEEGAALPEVVLSDLEQILRSMAQTEHLAESQRLAELIQAELGRVLPSDNRGVKQAPFKVLMEAATPAVLVEVGFITSPREAKMITDPQIQDRIISALARAILSYQRETNERLGVGSKEDFHACPANP